MALLGQVGGMVGFIKKADQPPSFILSSSSFLLLAPKINHKQSCQEANSWLIMVVLSPIWHVLSSVKKWWDSRAAGGLEFKEAEIHSADLDNLGPLLFYSILDTWA